MPLKIVRDNIVHMQTDAIVNAANERLAPGGGVCGAIFSAAGYEQMERACEEIGFCKTGSAVITDGFALPAKYVIHAVGPVYADGNSGEEEKLRSCYRASLAVAKEHALSSVAFPIISSGIYGYPKDKALSAAVSEIGDFLMKNDMEVYLVVYDISSFRISEKLFGAINAYIDDTYAETMYGARNVLREREEATLCSAPLASFEEIPSRKLEDVIGQIEETFSESLIRLIDEKGKTDVEVYKKANIDRKLFSKIRSNKEYKPSKNTVIAFAVALELSLDETKDLLAKAGYAISHSRKGDVIIEYFIENKNYNIFEINEALFFYEQPLLGA